MTLQIPMSAPDITQDDVRAVTAVLETPYLSLGPRIQVFEGMMAEYIGVEHAIAVSSGTAGLHLSVIAAGVGQGDEVITTPFSFVATAEAIARSGATPVFVDINPDTFTIEPKAVEQAMTRRTVGILPVHLYGHPCAIDLLLSFAKRRGLFIVEDCAQAFGSGYKDRKVGTFGDCSGFSFFPSKPTISR